MAAPLNHNKPWDEREINLLGFYWGVFSLETLGKRFNRTPWAVGRKAAELKLGPFSKGTISVRQFEELSGFSRPKIYATAKLLNIKLGRVVPSIPARGKRHDKRAFAITEEQQEVLLKYMLENEHIFQNGLGSRKTTQGMWGVGVKPAACKRCGSSSRPHYAKGYCRICYDGVDHRKKQMTAPITAFKGPYHFLSNFYLAEIEYEGALYASTEHAYQAAKTLDLRKRESLQRKNSTALAHNATLAKRWGRRVAIRPDWEDMKLKVMEELLREKFTRHPDLAEMLMATAGRDLVEGNTWGDSFWGVYQGAGENHLGKLLMKIRAELQKVEHERLADDA